MRGRLLVIEGIDGAGKDTQINKLVQLFQENGKKVEVVGYPDRSGSVGKVIQSFLNNECDFSPEVQFLLYATDMLKDRENIRNWIESGATVLLNRYITSTIAYQGTQGFPLKKAIEFTTFFDFIKPDSIIYLNISASTAVRRKINQKAELDRFESKESLLQKIADFYDGMAQQHVLGAWTIIDGERSPEHVFEEIKKHLQL